ncbi:MAG: ATP-binding protein [Peptococcaceae bacterium]|jgi:energy-coupling factor transporter ATP-binding protein EcfA2|nr:ATP-binding protein [Peptococcaceae bacterium]
MTNAITRLEIKDFLVFKGEFGANFCPGVNVLIGGNGTGKTTLMKVMYAACDWGNQRKYTEELSHIFSYFSYIYEEQHRHRDSFGYSFDPFSFKVSTQSDSFSINAWNFKDGYRYREGEFLNLDAIFIPAIELLSHSKGLASLNEKYALAFDKTETDLLVNAELPVRKEPGNSSKKLLDRIAKTIEGEVVYEDDQFFITKNSGLKLSFAFEASGFRKFGMLWKLLRNGLLESGSVLFWDEPENSLNPELVPVLVNILLELSRNGVQIFAATHDYNLTRHFDVRKDRSVPVLFHNLSKTDGGIQCESSPDYIRLRNNLLESANADLFNAVVADAMGVQDHLHLHDGRNGITALDNAGA